MANIIATSKEKEDDALFKRLSDVVRGHVLEIKELNKALDEANASIEEKDEKIRELILEKKEITRELEQTKALLNNEVETKDGWETKILDLQEEKEAVEKQLIKMEKEKRQSKLDKVEETKSKIKKHRIKIELLTQKLPKKLKQENFGVEEAEDSKSFRPTLI